ncbi:DUF4394 domain-containing protein [Piscinibacter sakaiensis]|uniref:DUF4394 domain-containing protein n=1 Tax=Piscinibacter sakaiensis TaxID=1547922 RepID=UPI00372B6979
MRFNAGRPGELTSRQPLKGLQPGETVLGMDFRVAKGQLYVLGSSGRLYRADVETATLTPVGPPAARAFSGSAFGVDFNPTVDRVRVVSDSGMNLRLHPDTGAVVDANPALEGLQIDGPLAYVAGDPNAGRTPSITGAAYTYNKNDEKITTNYAIDSGLGVLVMQGSREGTQPVVSPNTGQLRTVGALGVAPFRSASFDIADVNNAAYAALNGAPGERSRWVQIDLETGRATPIGTIGGGQPVLGIAIEP